MKGEVGNASVSTDDGAPAVQADYALAYVSLDTLRSSVRPVLTYAFFALFAFIKLSLLVYAVFASPAGAGALGAVLWNDGTEALFGAVIGFWYGTQMLRR